MIRKQPMLTDNTPPAKKLKTANKGYWAHGLQQSLSDKDTIIKKTEHVSVIKDKFPKAKHHYLIIHPTIPSISSLRKEHITLIKHIIEVGKEIESDINKDSDIVIKMGFHAIPSMSLLHMHVISNDYDSLCLKHKKHWNSFTSEFFIPADKLLKQLMENGRIVIEKSFYEEILKRELSCHLCKEKPKNMPKLKEHIRMHFMKK